MAGGATTSPHDEAARLLASDPRGAARRALDILKRTPGDVRARLVLGAARRRQGDLEGARTILEPLALAHSEAAFARGEAAMTLGALAEAAAQAGRWGEAEDLADRRLVLDPDSRAARRDVIGIRLRAGRAAEALAAAGLLAAAYPEDPEILALLAACQVVMGDPARAIAMLEPLLAKTPEADGLWLTLGHALKTAGRITEAASAYRRAQSVGTRVGEALWSLANLKTIALTEADEAAITEALERSDSPLHERIALFHARGKALEDRRDWAGAFAAYAQGARLRRDQIVHDAAASHRRMEAMRETFSPAFFAARREGGVSAPAPIFIVGLPRSGSTLIEQILASHPDVEGTAELPYMTRIARGLEARGGYLPGLAGLTEEDRTALGEAYLAAAAAHRRQGAPRFIDKAPGNVHHIGLIRLILPRAVIIDTRRHPLACGVSAFKQLFASGHDWSYDLAEIGAHIRDYQALMRHFDAALPGAVIRVRHEDLVRDLETGVGTLLDACGLASHPACLRFWETDRPVASASAAQVRRPLDIAGLDRWRVYEPWLGPMAAALGEGIETWRD